MRRKDRALSPEETQAILERGEYGILSTLAPDGQPCATPLSYICMDGALYFHSALEGLKLDSIRHCPKVCFCVVGETLPIYDGNFTTYFESVLVYGQATLVDDRDEKQRSLMVLAEKYLPDHMDKAEGDIAHSFNRTVVIKLTPERTSGKAKRKK